MEIKFYLPFIDEEVVDEVVRTLRSGWITTGSKVKEFEHEIKKHCSYKEVICVNSWTSGAILTLKWLGVKQGDEVILPAYTYAATALAVIHAGATPVLVDIADDLNISIDQIKKAITPRTKAVIGVDIAGYPCNYGAIKSLVSDAEIIKQFHPTSEIQEALGRIIVISDAAHSFGATNNVSTKDKADIRIYSFHAVKNITTAEGGAICLNLPKPLDNSEQSKIIRLRTLNSQTKDNYMNYRNNLCVWKYDIVDVGMKINMPDVNAAIGLAQVKKYPELLLARKAIFNRYNEAFSKYHWAITPPSQDDVRESSYHLYTLRINGISEAQRDKIIEGIIKQKVSVNVHFIPLPMLTVFKNMGYDINDFPESYLHYSREISLPIYPQLTDVEIDKVVKVVISSYDKVMNS